MRQVLGALVKGQSLGRGMVFGAGSFAVALAARFALGDALALGFPFLTFFPAVILAALVGGAVPGTVTAIASLAAAWYFFIPPVWSFALSWPSGHLALGFFAVIMALDILLIEWMSRVLRALDAAQAEAARQLEARRAMFQELQHRVANNMQFVSALLALHAGRVEDPATARLALADAQRRMATLARIHRRLHDPEQANRDFGSVVGEICEDLKLATGIPGVACTIAAPPLALSPDRLTALALIATEAVTNSLKHAFAQGRVGRIDVTVTEGHAGFTMTVRDDGPGLPADFDSRRGRSLGMKVLHALASQLDGALEVFSDDGAVIRVAFPLLAPAGRAAA